MCKIFKSANLTSNKVTSSEHYAKGIQRKLVQKAAKKKILGLEIKFFVEVLKEIKH